MKNSLKQLKLLLAEQLESLEMIRDISTSRKFSGNDSEIESYSDYLDIRQPYFDNIARTNKAIGSDLMSISKYSQADADYHKVMEFMTYIKNVKDDILTIDKKNDEIMGQLTNRLASEVRTISEVRKGRDNYNSYQNQNYSTYIDSKS